MSWAEEDWTVGLSGRVLLKVKELQVLQERLSRENKQKQLQLDNIHTSLEKQTVKYEEVRVELQSVQRELQSVRDEAKAAVTSRERLTQELQTKQAQVCSLEGQLDSARTVNNKLTQDVKRLEGELEKLQNSSRTADTTLFSTPCWNTTSPWEHNGSRQEEKSGQRDEGQSRALHSRQRLQFSDMPSASLPRQHKSTPHRHPSDQSDIFSTPLAAFPWERDDSRPVAKRRLPSPQTPSPDVTNQGVSEQGVCGKDKDHTTKTDISLSEMQSRIFALEEELSAKSGKLISIQSEMAQSKKELAAKEVSLQKARDELSLAHTRMAQDSNRASGAEQRLKQLQEELKCQRQNAESSRLQHQQRTKELEKQHQRDLTELQKERQCLEKQHQQEVNKLNQELQQARTLHNALQAQSDKLTLQKQALDKELEALKEKLKWTEEQLKESQKKETQTQAKLTEAVREAEGVAVSLEQSRKRERALEEEGRKLAEERADALRLLKELQEQSAQATPPQPVQFCPVGQSVPSFSHPARLTTHNKRPAATRTEQKREEEEGVHERAALTSAPYPSDREPGEGIDSEHITDIISPESLQKASHKRKSNEDQNRSGNESKCDTSAEGDRLIDPEDSPLPKGLMLLTEKTTSLKSEQTTSSEDLKRENAMLHSELNDVREELQKRLEDLETQRRAETEARTRLRQLSHKHASQALDREEKDKEWRAQLESERAETEKLRKVVAALEADMKRDIKEREEQQEEETDKKQEDRESEMIELNIQLKKQLAEVKAQLALEREEREREEDERNQILNTDTDVKKELSIKLAELTAELEELKSRRKDELKEEEKLSVANSPLTYLTFHDDELNSNVVCCDRTLLPSPEQHLLFCQSTNQRNMLMSQAAGQIIQEEQKVINPKHSGDDQTGGMTPDLDDNRQNCLGGPSLSDLHMNECTSSDLGKEVERLQKEYAKETERANQYQVKLEALQSQVTRQTQQLTMAFEKQSQHISGLLAELQEKESTLLNQEGELQQCKKELEGLKTERISEVMMVSKEVEVEGQRVEQKDVKLVKTSQLQSKQEMEGAVTCISTKPLVDNDLNAQRNAMTGTMDAETPNSIYNEILWSGGQYPDSVNTQNNQRSASVMTQDQCTQHKNPTDLVSELLALRLENQLLKQSIEGLKISDQTNNPKLQTDSKNSDTVAKELQLKGVCGSEDERGDLQREDWGTTRAEDLEEVSQDQANHLQQQVEALQIKVRTLSEKTQQQAEELAVWRLASQPATTFAQFFPNIEDQCETQEQISAVIHSQTNQQQMDEKTQHQKQSQGNITVIREDELFLSSSNKLHGRMLVSRLQNNNHPEPKSLQSSKKSPPQIHDADKESEKENQDINVLQWSEACPAQYNDTELVQMSSEKMTQQHVTKHPHKSSGPNPSKAQCYSGRPGATPNVSRATSIVSISPDRDVKMEMKSVSSQTEESLYHHDVPTVYVSTQTEEAADDKEEELVESPPVSPVLLTEGAESGDKMLFSGSFPIPADPARLAERIRRNRTQMSAAFDDTEYEPYGLPEVVMKGFADIPSGPSCPYIVRRGLLGTTVVPVSQKDTREEEETD
ncbi:centromere protein F-like isoform X1 [Parambassis ranga]|uniref:Centromere protein F-like isoform X1 n=2 Tax=Parambassis ranga TaxID=210632 RepID=A0A6P7J5U0_9TELE|nr:centromere protein F-like isoform X1 [Parambassis ranga]